MRFSQQLKRFCAGKGKDKIIKAIPDLFSEPLDT